MTMYLKKGFLAFMIFLTVSCTAFPSLAGNITNGSCGPDLTWTYDPGTKTLTISGTGTMPDYYSDSYAGSPAPWIKSSSIGDNLEKVEILNGVANIGENAFYYCGKLKSITIANSVTSIASNAFYHCDALPDITIPESVTFIGDDAFSYCNGLTSITIPGTVTSIGDGAFSSCDGLTSVTISDGVQSAGEYTFYLCNKLENISLPDSLTSIGVNAFYGTAYYNDETKWEDYVLYIGNHLIKTDEWEINHATETEYSIKPGTISIADYALAGCDKLENITLPDSLVSIGNYAFTSCSGLTDMKITQSVTNIGNYAFEACTDLANIRVDEGNPAYRSENGVLYTKDKSEIKRFPCKKTDTVFAIPSGVTTIADGAFERCWNLTNITIPNGVTDIGNDTFNFCSALKNIIIPEGVTGIGDKVFYGCSDLETVTIPNSVMSIGEYAFSECNKLTKVNYIGDETDWAEIAKGKSYSISDSIIEYCKGISAKRTEDGKIVVKPIKLNSGIIILALYDGNRLAQVQAEKYNGTGITFEPSKAYTYAKVMAWSDLERLFPECEARVLK